MKRLLILVALAIGAWYGYSHGWLGKGAGQTASGYNLKTDEGLRALAATVKAQDVVMYTTSTCPYCQEARGWLAQYGFAYTECNLTTQSSCEAELKSHKASGVPFLLVKGKPMHDGFDTQQFLDLLQQ